ncbi:Gfo/Idh/MocA family protein [Dethiothermospora halolimnae]|uniref:Gfo/Idh/MocA family protein n=1 Tax=Dethiothermospora halolimnae TaxID=3114390 RepID=UPI003CCC10F0
MNKTINIGIIGVGIVGERFIKALNRHGRANILGIYDTNKDRLQDISNKYNLKIVNSYKELLKNEDINIIYLAVPPKYHYSIGMDIIESNKHFICEKPLANSINEAKEMYEKAEDNNIIHAMNFPTVYTQAFKKMNSLLKQEYIGELRRIELNTYFEEWPRFWQKTNWIDTREQGGFVREVFTHYVQLIQMIFGKIKDVDTNIEYPKDSLSCETGIMARASLTSGEPILLNGFSNIGMKENIALTLYGTEGTISLENWRELWVSSKGKRKERLDFKEHDHLVELIDEVCKRIDGKASNVITFKDGYNAQIIIEKLLDRD